MKFKVGDKVRIVKVADNNKYIEKYIGYREKYIGKVCTIESINPNGSSIDEHYGLENPDYYIFYADELELVEFTKSDLKDGMVVEYRDGDRRMVIGDKLIGNIYWGSLAFYNENLNTMS